MSGINGDGKWRTRRRNFPFNTEKIYKDSSKTCYAVWGET